MYGALIFTSALLAATAYFVMGGLPLLILKHDEPMDARFVRSFFKVYYRMAFWASIGACVSYGIWGRYELAAAALAFTGLTVLLRKYLMDAMLRLGRQIELDAQGAIRSFRRVHALALLVNVLLLPLILWSLYRLTSQWT